MRTATPARARQLARYRRESRAFLADHPWCESPLHCGNSSTEVHHRRGRRGDLLLDQAHWSALCRDCHEFATVNPTRALELGMSETRHVVVHAFIADAGGAYCTTCGLPRPNWRHREAM